MGSGVKSGINLLKGVGISLAITLISLFIFTVILTYTNISEIYIEPVIMVITGLSILIGSFFGNTKIKKNGMLNGGLVGLIYLLILYLVSSLLNWKFGLNIQSIVMIIIGCICGITGGIFGINMKN